MGAILFKSIFSFCLALAAVPEAGEKSDYKLLTRSVGRVAKNVVTSREITINSFIEDKLYRSKRAKNVYKLGIGHSNFVQETTAVLLEMAIAQEGLRFPVARVDEKDLNSQKRKFLRAVRNDKAWQVLEVEEAELNDFLRSKMSAKKFINFKVSTATLPISDQEALAYYNKNRFKFDKLPFENFKKNIKSFLNKRRVDARLREWFEVLQIKYNIQNHLTEEKA